MRHALTYSIVQHIENKIPELSEVIWMRDGISLTGKQRPFVVVKYMTKESRLSTVGRTNYDEEHVFQIGLHGTEFGLPRESERLETALREQIPFIDTTNGLPAPITGAFYLDDVDVTDVPWASDINAESDRWRVEIDFVVRLSRNNGAYEFTK